MGAFDSDTPSPGQVEVVAEGGASLEGQCCREHLQGRVHGPPLPQGLEEGLDVHAARHEVGQQQQAVEAVEPWGQRSEVRGGLGHCAPQWGGVGSDGALDPPR